MAPHGISFSKEQLYGWAGVPTQDFVQRLSAASGVQLDVVAVVKEKDERFFDELKTIQPIAAVIAIAQAHAGRIPMAVASGSSRRTVMEMLRQLQILDWFDAIVTAEDVKRPKPAPDVFLEAARQLGVAPAACCGYEDAELGLQALHAAGMDAVDVREMG